ncbi:hypothetical protein INS49_010293 [Diaporthe citri]|uniref:uncharacterized protein n=1 Tax=Diaporthe citri TaxID=83186 RepID=UPI001C80C842|nr:uncharacterized protein INS49_010293 [Diaporthe citri]KAG6362064.1 hypothetical protein INS49_010293 [Diaporthe citri]
MSPAGGVLAPVVMRALRSAVVNTAKMTKVLQRKLAGATQPLSKEVQYVTVRSTGRQPIHPTAFLRQSKRGVRWTSSTAYNRLNASVRRFITTAANELRAAPRIDRSAFNQTNVGRAFSQFPGRAPFAHTLRPNLTGGAMPRTAGGYAMPGSGRVGGQRYFSHGPTSQAQVVQNVSQAMRAFWLSGQRAHFDGHGPNGEKRYKPVTSLQESAGRKMASMPRMMPGSFVDFQISPTVTALSPLAAVAAMATSSDAKHEVGAATLNADGFFDVLSTDFARQLKDLTAVMSDLKRLAALGDLPITLEKNNTLRVRFPGLDSDTVERLCDDTGVQRGVIKQDPEFDASYGSPMALRFPYAPDAHEEETLTSPGGSLRSQLSDLSSIEEDEALFDEYVDEYIEENPWLSTPEPEVEAEEGYESMSDHVLSSAEHVSEGFEGLEGIYRFLEECDNLKSQTRF